MIVYNEDKTEILENYDLETGHIIEEKEIIHHPKTYPVEAKGYYKTIMEYPNGGKDVEWVEEVPGQEGHEAYDEEVIYHIYKPYTQKEIEEKRNLENIELYKRLLSETDYKVLKYIEGYIPENEYIYIRVEREYYRNKIREAEGKYNNNIDPEHLKEIQLQQALGKYDDENLESLFNEDETN